MLFNHYKSIAPNEIISGHCNVTKDVIIDITDTTKNDLLDHFGYNRDDFFTGVAGFIVDEGERQQFLDKFLTKPMAKAYEREETKHELECFVQLPNESRGRYVHVNVILISSPETGDVMGFVCARYDREEDFQRTFPASCKSQLRFHRRCGFKKTGIRWSLSMKGPVLFLLRREVL